MNNKTIEQQAAERYPYPEPKHAHIKYSYPSIDEQRKAYIAGRTASANEERGRVWQILKDEMNCSCDSCCQKRAAILDKYYPPAASSTISEGQGEDWEPSHLSKGQQEASEIITKWTAKWAGLLTKKNNEIAEMQKRIAEAEMQKRIAELESQLSEGTGCYCLPLSHDPECPKHGNKASQLSEGTAKGGEEHNAVHIGIAEDCRLNSVTGEYEFTRASSQEAEGGELKDIIARIIEQNNNPTATAKIIALVEEHYSSQEAIAKAIAKAIAEANHTIDNLQKIIDEQREEMKAIAEKAWDECYLTLVSADCLHMVNLSKEDLDKEKASYLSQFSSPTENEK